jgi:hypothetical protein
VPLPNVFTGKVGHNFFGDTGSAKLFPPDTNVICPNKLVKSTPGQFHQHVYVLLLHAQIPKMQRDSQIISDFYQFWDLSM